VKYDCQWADFHETHISSVTCCARNPTWNFTEIR